MNINSINIKNFKSYLDEHILDLNPGINIFVGRNGHGKSNFFQAIAFVLSDKYVLSKPEDKIPILYSDLRDEISNELHVQLNFNNQGRRIPIEDDEVSLKRTWTHDNKDEYKLNTKILIKNEINNILESCGLSRSNPYNIVHQGKISKMTNMSSEDIYELLQEITGIKQYQIKKEESLKYLNETSNEKTKIKEILDEIKLKIEDISNEKDAYENYERKENQAKCLEFCIYQCHINDLQEKIEEISNEIKVKTEEMDNIRNSCLSSENTHISIQQELSTANTNSKLFQEKRQALELEIAELISKQNFIDKDVNLENNFNKDKGNTQSQIKKKMDAANKELSSLQQKKLSLQTELKTIEGEIVENESSFLLANTKFKTVSEKKAFLDNEIDHLKEMLLENTKTKKDFEISIDNLEVASRESKISLESIEKDLKNNESQLQEIQKNILSKKMSKMQLASDFRGNIEKINEFSLEIEEKNHTLKNYRESLDHRFRDNYFSNICRLKEILRERNIQGFFGLFIDLIQFDPKLRLGIESLTKNKLYSVIVDDYETAKILVEINKEIKGSVLNIYPLTWAKELKRKERNYPKSQDVIVLKQKVSISQDFKEFQEEMEILIEHFFGKALMVKNYDLAVKFAQEYKLNCVTVKGEIVYSEGYLTKVGFCDANAEKINQYLKYKSIETDIQTKIELLEFEKKKTNDLHSKEISLLRDLQELNINETQIKKQIENLKIKKEEVLAQIKNQERETQNYEEFINKLENENEKINQKIKIFSQEKNVKLNNENENSNNISTYKIRNEELLKQQTRYNELKEQIILTEEKIKEINLVKGDLQREISQESENSTNFKEKDAKNIEKESIESVVKELKKSLKEVEKKQKLIEEERRELEKKENEIQEEINELHEKLVENEKNITQHKQTRNGLLAQKEEYYQKKGNLEVLQAEMISQYSQMDLEEILKEVERLRSFDKKKYTAKDRIIFEKLKDLQEKFHYFNSKLQEMDENEQGTRELIEKLDSKSESTVNEVFEVFKEHFIYYFKQLVIGGDALVKLVKISKEIKGKTQFSTGIDIKVHFVKENEEENQESGFQKMNKLSSGQKTIIALALIFALQSCDPAPFYVFDEIDAALDANYRKNIANILKENSKNAQYLISTFKPELTYIQDSNIYEVKFANKASHIDKISAQKARDILKSNEVTFEEKAEN